MVNPDDTTLPLAAVLAHEARKAMALAAYKAWCERNGIRWPAQ
jgi:hypothetical protein